MSGELTQRLQTAAVAQQQGQSLTKPGARPANVMQLFQYDVYRTELMRVLNDKDMVRRFLQAGLTECMRIKKLADCNWQSFAGALMQCAVTKLEPGPALGHAWLLPFKGNATFVLGYPGVVQLGWRSGLVADIHAASVCEGDEFFYDEGANVVQHRRPTRGKRGTAYAYYSVVRYVNGGRHIEFMTREEVDEHAQRYSPSYQSNDASSPWRTNFDEMAEKTCVLQGKKMMPASIEWVSAVSADERTTIWTPGSGIRPEDIMLPALPGPEGEQAAEAAQGTLLGSQG
jgi:recombination protein RecT